MHLPVGRLLPLVFLLLPAVAGAQGIVINAVGDVMLAGSGWSVFARKGYGFPFAATAAILKSGDLTVGNLEAPLSSGGEEYRDKRFRYRAAPQAATALKEAGFSVLTLANNHMLDYGRTGLADTLHNLDAAGIPHSGAGEDLAAARREAVVAAKGKRVAFLSYSLTEPKAFYAGNGRAGTAPGYLSYITRDIGRVRPLVDYVVVSFHWGTEMATTPKPYQVTVAHRAIDAGADLVLGHHPHVLQGAERYRGGVIFYSLGNFAFGTASRAATRSVIARITLNDGVEAVELIPLNVLNREVRYQPRPLTGRRGQEVADQFGRLSAPWGTVVVKAGERYLLDFEPRVSRRNHL
jgi:poly-gamma-glutamate synthesis protein (capsule biosynthesis protein)